MTASAPAPTPQPGAARIRVEALHRTFALSQGEVVAVGDVSFEIGSREFVSIIGIPFALKDLELAKLALAPVGRTIRDKA